MSGLEFLQSRVTSSTEGINYLELNNETTVVYDGSRLPVFVEKFGGDRNKWREALIASHIGSPFEDLEVGTPLNISTHKGRFPRHPED
ncbi:MAG: hypothetical protein WBB28_01370 [Crinalium sp.]